MSEPQRAGAKEPRGGPPPPSSSSSSSPPEGLPEKKRKGRKGKAGAGRKAAPEGDAGPALPPKLKEMKSQESPVGETLVLRCEASSDHSSLKFKWLKNGKEITKRNRPENIKIKSPKKQKTFSELRISKASLDDAGEYTCKASNRFGNDTTKARVIITDTNETTGMIPVLTKGANTSSQYTDKIPASTERTNTSSSTSTSTTGTSHLTKCDVNKRGFCVNGGECFMVKDLPSPRYLCSLKSDLDMKQEKLHACQKKRRRRKVEEELELSCCCNSLPLTRSFLLCSYCKIILANEYKWCQKIVSCVIKQGIPHK